MATQGTQNVQSPIDNLTFDIITILHAKAKALEAYDQYLKDAQGNQDVHQLLQTIRQQDTKHVEQLQQCLVKLLGNKGSQSASGTGKP